MSANKNVAGSETRGKVREAYHEVQRYFSDELAPMMVSDSVELLMRCPPQVIVTAIKHWIGTQRGRKAENASVSDYLFHALRKLHQMVEYELIEPAAMKRYLKQTGDLVLLLCPEGERALLKENLARLGSSEGTVVAQVDILHRQPGQLRPPGAAGPGSATGSSSANEVARGMRRLGLMLERLGQAVPTTAEATSDLHSQALAAAAVSARDGKDFERFAQQLRGMGVDARMDQVFRSLGRGLPGWSVNLRSDGADGSALPQSAPERAMRRIFALAEGPGEGLQRVGDMVDAAIEQFNDGALAQATKMLELACRALEELKLDPEVAKGIRRRKEEALSSDRLREFADEPEKHSLLARLLEFFPAYTVGGLLDALSVEKRRDRRRTMLSLLEVHGLATRQPTLERLEAGMAGSFDDPFGYFQRNLVFLLRRIPPPDGHRPEIEIDYFVELSGLHYPKLLTRESIGALSQIKHPKTEQALIARLGEIETALTGNAEGKDTDELRGLLDRIAAGLARQGSSTALRALVKHAFKRQPALGNSMGRLDELAGLDLSVDPELVEHLLKALKREVPIKVLGFVMPKNRENVLRLVRSLSHTPTPEVRQALEEIGANFGDQDFANEARSILASFDTLALPSKRKEPHKGLSGDVELFGLPNLLQSLSESRISGTLTLRDSQEEMFATLVLVEGRIQSCRSANLDGESAFYQLFQTPAPGSFAFEAADGAETDTAAPALLDVQSGLLEALRRYDELQQAKALVPDDAVLRATGKKPTSMEGESDVPFLREVWTRASAGVSPRDCESALGVDSYRVRRLYAHWLETEALRADGKATPVVS